MLWAAADNYFSKDRQAREMLADPKQSGLNIRIVEQLALWSFHPLGKAEAEEKRARGEQQQKRAAKFHKGCDSGIAFYESYLHLTDEYPENQAIRAVAKDAVERISALQEQMQQIASRREQNRTFDAKRLGTSWNSYYAYLLKAHLSFMTGWNDGKVLTAIVHLVRAMQETKRPKPLPEIRRLLQKAIRHFETNPHNARIVERLDALGTHPVQLSRLFPLVTSVVRHSLAE